MTYNRHNSHGLTDKQEAFCREYLIDCNATLAAQRAGYSERSAKQNGWRLMQEKRIQDRMATLKAERNSRLEITADDVIRQTARLAFSDIRDYFDDDGAFIAPREIGDDAAAALTSIKVHKDGSIEFKLAEKMRPLEALAKHTGAYDLNEVNQGPVIQVIGSTGLPKADD